MDNRINEIRKKIKVLRTKMLEAETTVHAQINRDEDYIETSLELLAMRTEMSELAKERARLGDDREPILIERFMNPRRPIVVRSIGQKPSALTSPVSKSPVSRSPVSKSLPRLSLFKSSDERTALKLPSAIAEKRAR